MEISLAVANLLLGVVYFSVFSPIKGERHSVEH